MTGAAPQAELGSLPTTNRTKLQISQCCIKTVSITQSYTVKLQHRTSSHVARRLHSQSTTLRATASWEAGDRVQLWICMCVRCIRLVVRSEVSVMTELCQRQNTKGSIPETPDGQITCPIFKTSEGRKNTWVYLMKWTIDDLEDILSSYLWPSEMNSWLRPWYTVPRWSGIAPPSIYPTLHISAN